MGRIKHRLVVAAVVSAACTLAIGAIVNLTPEDFHVSGTQMGSIAPGTLISSGNCAQCHGGFDAANEPAALWRGSLMGNAGRDPLFFAQMTLANQDVSNAGYYCMRCHVPNAIVSGHALPADGSALSTADIAEGVGCHLCHSMVDPIYQPGASPSVDQAILQALGVDKPDFYGNAMFVIDPQGRRRGARADAQPLHEAWFSPFHARSEMCATCHEVGNVAVSRRTDGTYMYNAIGQPSPSQNPHEQFPLERTYSEWKNSAFATGGVDMGGRFGGTGVSVVSSCQDCHMPRATANLSPFGPTRPDARRHEFAGAAAQVLDLIVKKYESDVNVDTASIRAARGAAVSMLERAATVETRIDGPTLHVRVINETGHKLPTGHIEGRRVWVNVKYFARSGQLIAERGHYDQTSAELTESDTTVYEMHVGLNAEAAAATGLQAGPTSRMALANVIVKDNRIPPRGFANAAFAAAGSPVVGAAYADGQHWADETFAIPGGCERAEVSLYYQNTPKDYIEHLRDANVSDSRGTELHALWTATGKGAPIWMAGKTIDVALPVRSDFGRDGRVNIDDIFIFLNAWLARSPGADFDGSGTIEVDDVFDFLASWFAGV
jgi:mono/diheme cytochrome c family protein